ncbi:MAG: hypothetical protein Q8L14_19315 [Myxococcales bacterium]|nr:hypothetical protein [Myxococcales bacterium]
MTLPGYTVLRVAEDFTIPLMHRHAERLGEGAFAALTHFVSLVVDPGVYRVTWDGRQLSTLRRPASRLSEGMPTRRMVSPMAAQRGRFPKPAPPSPYDGVRLDGVSTLLTNGAGDELYESCSATLVAWDGEGLVLPPEDAPAVASVAEAAIAANEPVRRRPLAADGTWPLLLVNAVAGTCAIDVPGRGIFPADVRARLTALLAREDA